MRPPLVLAKKQFCHQKKRFFEQTASMYPLGTIHQYTRDMCTKC